MVGNLASGEARTCFFDYILPFCKLPPGADAAWERVYEVCGGNPGLLRSCALEVTKFSSWKLGASCVRTAVPRLCGCAHCAACAQAATPSCEAR